MTADPTWTDISQTAIQAATLFVIAAAAVVAWWQVREARHLRLEQNRPFVVIDFEREEASRGILLKITNIGNSLARDVRFEFDPPLEATWSHVPFNELKMFSDGIPTLPPGKVIQTLFDISVQRFPRRDELPDIYKARVRYTDEKGKRPFDELITLDLGIYWNLTFVERRGLHDIYKLLEKMLAEFKKWTAGSRGLLHLSPQEMAEREEEILRRFDADAMQAEEASIGTSSGS
jgi:hypothetical protein